jgi:hypothetical protein
MKKLISGAALLLLFLVAHINAQAQRGKAKGHYKHRNAQVIKHNYYFYPQANVYYEPSSRMYWHQRNGVWVRVNVLPSTIIINGTPRYEVWYDGTEVWREHPSHCRRYPSKIRVVAPPPRPGVQVNINL